MSKRCFRLKCSDAGRERFVQRRAGWGVDDYKIKGEDAAIGGFDEVDGAGVADGDVGAGWNQALPVKVGL